MKIVVLAGGTSTERDVSFVSGSKVYNALKQLGHDVILIDVFYGYNGVDANDVNALFTVDRNWAADIKAITETDPDIEAIKAQRPGNSNSYFGPHVIEICQAADIAFLALHGGDGENGKVQAALDLFGVKYTGTGYMSSALAMDKFFTKVLLDAKNIPTPEWKVAEKGDEEKPSPFGLPCVIKTGAGGSSVGVYIPKTEEEYRKNLIQAYKYGNEVLIERYIKGREFTCAVIDGKAYPVVEIAPKEGFYDYKNKYQAGSTVETCPAEISAEATANIQETAVNVYKALGMESYARMDFMMDENGNAYCLEANTLPGMTPTSLVPQEAAAVGIDFPHLCQLLIDVSMKKYN
ncbi:D-alanine-D-alanine ligase [Lachnospiraceae bacterium KH1T2]|nr:D-alanine-D-alanine ligase [Lachnospiraceae bacterium KH1T2]